jgi:hypothetical protein
MMASAQRLRVRLSWSQCIELAKQKASDAAMLLLHTQPHTHVE